MTHKARIRCHDCIPFPDHLFVRLLRTLRHLNPLPASTVDPQKPEIMCHFKPHKSQMQLLPGWLYSVNYDHRFTKEIGFRIGFTTWSAYTGLPLTVNYLVGGPDSFMEIGIGVVPGYTTLPGTTRPTRSFFAGGPSKGALWGTGTLGYRYQPDSGGFVFRIAFTPFLCYGTLTPWGGISLGYAF